MQRLEPLCTQQPHRQLRSGCGRMRHVETRGPAFLLRYSQGSLLVLPGTPQNTLIFRYSSPEAAVRKKDKDNQQLHRLRSGKVIRVSGLYSIPTAAAKTFFPVLTDTGPRVLRVTRVTQGGFSWRGFGFKSHHHSCPSSRSWMNSTGLCRAEIAPHAPCLLLQA